MNISDSEPPLTTLEITLLRAMLRQERKVAQPLVECDRSVHKPLPTVLSDEEVSQRMDTTREEGIRAMSTLTAKNLQANRVVQQETLERLRADSNRYKRDREGADSYGNRLRDAKRQKRRQDKRLARAGAAQQAISEAHARGEVGATFEHYDSRTDAEALARRICSALADEFPRCACVVYHGMKYANDTRWCNHYSKSQIEIHFDASDEALEKAVSHAREIHCSLCSSTPPYSWRPID